MTISLEHGTKYLDFFAAFDTIDQNKLLNILRLRCGFHGQVLHRFKPYLTDRSQRVHITNRQSKPRKMKHGVPQGSVLGPIICSFYTGTLKDIIERHGIQYHKYADDT